MATQEPEATSSAPTKVCPNCGVQSQTNSDKCPSCGKGYKQKRRGGCLKWLGILTLGLVALIIIIAVSSGGDEKSSSSSSGNDQTTEESKANTGPLFEAAGTANATSSQPEMSRPVPPSRCPT